MSCVFAQKPVTVQRLLIPNKHLWLLRIWLFGLFSGPSHSQSASEIMTWGLLNKNPSVSHSHVDSVKFSVPYLQGAGMQSRQSWPMALEIMRSWKLLNWQNLHQSTFWHLSHDYWILLLLDIIGWISQDKTIPQFDAKWSKRTCRRGAASMALYPQVEACSSVLSACARSSHWKQALGTFLSMRCSDS